MSRSAARTAVHVVDATDFQQIARRALESYLARAGKPVRLRLDAIVPAFYVGPVAASRVLLNDAEALARRPDRAAIVRKVSRLRINSEIEIRNREAILAVGPLVEHLADRLFTRADVEALVERYCQDPTIQVRIVRQVFNQTLCFGDSARGGGGAEQFHILPAYRETEARIARLFARLNEHSPSMARPPIDGIGELGQQLAAGYAVSLLDITAEENANALTELVVVLQKAGECVVMATHLSKRRAPPPGVRLLPLHWQGSPAVPPGAVVLIDEADELTLRQLETILRAADAAHGKLVFCRRSYRRDFVPHPTLSALIGQHPIRLGPQARHTENLPFELVVGRTAVFMPKMGDVIDHAVLCSAAVARRGRKIFFLCGDPLVSLLLVQRAQRDGVQVHVGSTVPMDWRGKVIVMYAGAPCSAAHLRSISGLRPQFLVAQTSAVDLTDLAAKLRYAQGLVTTLNDKVEPNFLTARTDQHTPYNPVSSVAEPWRPGTAPLFDPYDSSPEVLERTVEDDIGPDQFEFPGDFELTDGPDLNESGDILDDVYSDADDDSDAYGMGEASEYLQEDDASP